jgi:endo-1,4-beta-xylanase
MEGPLVKSLKLTLLATSLSFACALVHAQDTATVVEAETAATNPVPLGAQLTVGTDAQNVSYVTLTGSTIGGGSPPTADRIATLEVTFPAPGTYELYMRMWVGPTNNGADDDSFFYGNGFGLKAAGNADDWITANQLFGARGYTNPTDKVLGGGLAGTQVWKWLKLSAYAMDEPGRTFEVTAGNLTQTLQLAGREDGFRIDKIAFARQGLFFTVNDLDNGLPGSTVPPPPPFTPPGPPIATGQEKFLGSAHSPAQAPNFERYWNKVTPENGGKWGSVEGTRNQMNWTELDAAYAVAQANGFPFHHHVLIWGNQQPNWIAALPAAEQLAEIQEWFTAVATRYPDIDIVEVFNEPLHDLPDDPADGGYYAALGGAGVTGWDGVIKAFEMARATFPPTAKLMLNDFSITNTDSATTRYIEIINLLKDRGLIDIIGVQGHAFSTTPNIPNQRHIDNLNRLGATGLPIHVTEFDVDGLDDDEQLREYQRIFPIFWEHPSVAGITLWGYRPGHWRSQQGAYIVLDNGAERAAMVWLQNYVQDKVPVVVPGQTMTVAENSAAGTTAGAVLATDEDTDASLAEWQISGGSGAALFTIDPLSGAISVATGASLDFEGATSYTLSVSVSDGFRRSAPETVTIELGNANDNAPAVTTGQAFRIDGGSRYVIGTVVATDADDTNQPGFTTLQGWQIAGGNGGSIFAVNPASGALEIKRPLMIDFRRSSYTLQLTVSDGANTSAAQNVSVPIPNNLRMCQWGFDVVVPKLAATLLLRLGGSLGTCRRH